MKVIRIVAIVLGVWVLVGLSLDAAIGYFQPRGPDTVVLRTFDAARQAHETVLRVREDNGQLWLVSGQWFRGWYHRALDNADVELVRDGVVAAYHAVPVDTPEARDMLTRLELDRSGAVRYWFGRAVLTLFAPPKLVRLDPRAPQLGVTRQSIIKVWLAERLERLPSKSPTSVRS